MVVGALFNVGASSLNGGSGTGMVDFFHGAQVAIMLTLMFNLVQFTYWTCKRQRVGSTWEVHGPTFYVLLSAILVNIQPIWILCIGSWELCCNDCAKVSRTVMLPGNKYPSVVPFEANCTSTGLTYPPWPVDGTPRECSMGGNVFWDITYCSGKQYSIFPTVWQGWMIQIVCTWGGFVLMFIGTMQATKLHIKLGNRWKAIRRGNARSVH